MALTPHQQPLNRLPLRPRPIGQELAGSYLHRLAATNHTAPAVLAHAIGHSLTGTPVNTLRYRGLELTPPALDRWATLADTPSQRLETALAHLEITVNDRCEPLLWWKPPLLMPPSSIYPDICPRCRAGHDGAELLPPQAPLTFTCPRHHLWIAAGETHFWLHIDRYPELHRASRRLTALHRHRAPLHLIAAWHWSQYYLRDWAEHPHGHLLTRRWSHRILDTGVPRSRLTATWPVFAMLPELVALTALFSDPAWTARATALPTGTHRDAYADLWHALHPEDPDTTNLHSITQFGTLGRDLADLAQHHQLLCDHDPGDHRPDNQALATWDFDGTVTPIRHRV